MPHIARRSSSGLADVGRWSGRAAEVPRWSSSEPASVQSRPPHRKRRRWWFRGSLALAPQPPAQRRTQWSGTYAGGRAASLRAISRDHPNASAGGGGFEARWRSHLNHRHSGVPGGRAPRPVVEQRACERSVETTPTQAPEVVVSRLAGARTSTTGTAAYPVVGHLGRWSSSELASDQSRPPQRKRRRWWFRGSLALAPQPPAQRRTRWSGT